VHSICLLGVQVAVAGEERMVLSIDKYDYYINTNEIPGDPSRENMISSHVKIICYLHL